MSAYRETPAEWDLLLSSAQKNQPALMRNMISTGVDPNHTNAVGQSSLHIASLWGHVDSARVLLEAGANPNLKNRLMGSTPLHMAAQSHKSTYENQVLMVELLVQYGADTSLGDDHGSLPAAFVDANKPLLLEKLQQTKPPIIQAISSINENETIEILKSDPTATNAMYMGQSAISFCLKRILDWNEDNDQHVRQSIPKAVSIFELLVMHIKEQGIESLTFDTAPALKETLEALKNEYRKSSTLTGALSPIAAALERLIQVLIDELHVPVTPECKDFLHQSSRKNEIPMVRFMIERLHVDPNFRGRQGMTALQFASRSGCLDTVTYLLSLDTIDIDVKDDRGQTALDSARVNQKETIVAALEAHQAQSHA